MINLIKSDFYKLFRTKAFYVCAGINIIWAVLGVYLMNANLDESLGITADLLNYDGVFSMIVGLGYVPLLVTVMISIFIPSEFSYGTMKNIASRGLNRTYIYLSKMVIGIFIAFSYVILSAVFSFALGSAMWGAGDITRATYLNIFKMLGLFLFAIVSMQSIFIMIGFLLRSTGRTVATNIAITMFVSTIVIPLINFAVDKWLKVEEFDFAKYWPETYISKYLSLEIAQNDVTLGLIVCAVTILISSGIGIFHFHKKDIK